MIVLNLFSKEEIQVHEFESINVIAPELEKLLMHFHDRFTVASTKIQENALQGTPAAALRQQIISKDNWYRVKEATIQIKYDC